ncbi:MAG: SRPBCC family protein [Austwickia sp.]|nr:SRPBCC family protein [Austwickia sp.]MBK8437137.1 SRPBCC family protein [Austwickia sp.]MBK9102371.1 SRPBCC family protein [Austwickia sp.]
MTTEQTIVSASRLIEAPAGVIFELIADPARQPDWDGNDNLTSAAPGQRVRAVGDIFTMTIHLGTDRDNHVVEFEEGRRIAWRPSEPGKPQPGHLWRWVLEPVDEQRTTVTHTYDWSALADPNRLGRARWTTSERLAASVDRLAACAEAAVDSGRVDPLQPTEHPRLDP